MKRIFISLFLTLLYSAIPATAQNPIIRNQYTADPTVRVFDGKLYLYPSHDIISPVEAEREWFCMADYHVFSSDNLTDWEDHGVILDQKDVPWGNPAGYAMWAPDCVRKNGKYYFYFPDAPKEGRGFCIGVATADSPTGPFMAEPVPLKVGADKIQIPEGMDAAAAAAWEAQARRGVMGIDPCVLLDSKGNAYIYWSGMGLRAAKLSDDMLSIEGESVNVGEGLPDGFKEGPFAFEREGRYYLTFPWVRSEGGTEALAYAMSDNPLGPFTYTGIIMDESPTRCWTNHHSIVEYNGQWYLFYHHNDFSPRFDKNRSVCADRLTFNADGTIRKVTPTLRGVGITDACSPIHPDRYSTIEKAGIEYIDTTNYFAGWYLHLDTKGARATYADVDFGPSAPTKLAARVRSAEGGTLRIKAGRSVVAEVEVPAMPGISSLWRTVDVPVKDDVTGLRTLSFELVKGDVDVDWVRFIPASKMTFDMYFSPSRAEPMTPDEEGFIRRWTLLEPISKPNRSNTVFTDSYLREAFSHEYFKHQMALLPTDGQTVKVEGQRLAWHCLDSKLYNTKLFRFASTLKKEVYGVLFWAVTVIHCDEDMDDVRLAVGSNSASMWWIDGEEALILSGDRRMVADDGMSARLTLTKGRHIVRGAVINGPGMSDFCLRFLHDDGTPVKNITITNK